MKAHLCGCECLITDKGLLFFSLANLFQAIGSDALFAPANLYATAERYPTQFHNDQDFFLRVTAADPLADWVNQGDWGGDDHCVVTGQVRVESGLRANERVTGCLGV